MKAFLMLAWAAILLAASVPAHAEKPRQAPPAMTEQEIKDYIDSRVDAAVEKAVKERVPLAFSTARTASAPVGYTTQACPAGASCPAGCVDNGDGTCSCPAGTSCGMSQYGQQGQYMMQGDGDDSGGGGCASGRAKRQRFHLFGKPHRR
jgi:hypothetical protein